MSSSVPNDAVETEGIEVPKSFQGREQAIQCWRAVVDKSGHQDKVLAAAARMTPSYFSKVSSGQQGCLLGMVYSIGEKFPELRRAFFARLHELEAEHEPVSTIDDVAGLVREIERIVGALVRLHGEIPLRMARAEYQCREIRRLA